MIRAFLLALCKIPLFLVGLLVVALLIPFRKTDEATRLPSGWVFTNIPGWWGNPCDGLAGDKRGDWAKECGGDALTFKAMWKWAALRNPVNYWSRCVAGVDVSRCVIDKLHGDDEVIEEPGVGGWQYLIARRDDGKTFPRLFAVFPYWFQPDKAFLIDIGWKIKLSHNNTPKDARLSDRAKGIVFTISPWKGLE